MAKRILIGVGVALAAVGVVWAWIERGRLSAAIRNEWKKETGVLRRDVSDAHKRVDWLMGKVSSVDFGQIVKNQVEDKARITAAHERIDELAQGAVSIAHKEATRAHGRITSLEARVQDIAAHLHGKGANCAEDRKE